MISKFKGFSIVEVLIALALSSILLTGIAQIYLSTKKVFYAQENLSRLQENSRFASYILTKNIRMAGYEGCTKSNMPNGLKGFDSGNLPGYLQGKVTSGTDVIVINKADSGITNLTEDISGSTNIIKVRDNPATKSNPWLFISDCKHSNKFKALSFASKTVRTETRLKDYRKLDTEVAQYTEIAYFIGQTPYKDEIGNPVYALYSITNEGRREELVDGINNMQIKYGVDTEGSGIVSNYYSANKVVDWNKVLSVYITLYLDIGKGKTKQWETYIALKQRAKARY
jgi:type IV pilus assembly protein PilW